LRVDRLDEQPTKAMVGIKL